MTKSPFFLYLIGFVLLLQTTAFSQLKYLKANAQVPDHPRIMLLKGEEKGIQNNIASDKNGTNQNSI